MNKIRYFDHAATTAVDEEVLKEMWPYFSSKYGNPSSIYTIGRNSKKAIEDARKKVAFAINANPKEIFFTGGGTESDNIAIKAIAYANKERGNHIITSKIEHPAILNSCKTLEREGFNVTYLDVDKNGLINIDDLKRNITDRTILISIMFANNEIGTIEPIEEIGKIAKEMGILFHTDSVQAVGNVMIDVQQMGIDLLSMSAHKFYGPKGIGALYIRDGVKCNKIQDGGHQERNMRAGTENVAGIVGLGKAIQKAIVNLEEYNYNVSILRDYYEMKIKKNIPYIKINGHKTKRLSGNSNISFEFVDGESLLLKLDEKGICVSTGSACSSGNDSPSHVLLAIGLEKNKAKGSLRVTFGKENTKEDVDYLVESLIEIVNKLRNMSPEYLEFVKNKL
ncbi:MAG: cysteine desulfurase NifS [Clostridia bacterium]|nr:cysteine desulfurase NifS [Clostridia bacterium]